MFWEYCVELVAMTSKSYIFGLCFKTRLQVQCSITFLICKNQMQMLSVNHIRFFHCHSLPPCHIVSHASMALNGSEWLWGTKPAKRSQPTERPQTPNELLACIWPWNTETVHDSVPCGATIPVTQAPGIKSLAKSHVETRTKWREETQKCRESTHNGVLAEKKSSRPP